MAKQIEDVKTAELSLPDVPRRRGRPSTGNALSAADRKRLQRDRDRRVRPRAVGQLLTCLPVLSYEALARMMTHAARSGAVGLVQSCADEFVQRAEISAKMRVSHEKGKS